MLKYGVLSDPFRADNSGVGIPDCINPESRDWRLSGFRGPDMFPYRDSCLENVADAMWKETNKFAMLKK